MKILCVAPFLIPNLKARFKLVTYLTHIERNPFSLRLDYAAKFNKELVIRAWRGNWFGEFFPPACHS